MDRRAFLAHLAAAPVAVSSIDAFPAVAAQESPAPRPRARIRQSVMGSVWGGTDIPFEERCRILSRIGFQAVDLPTPQQVPILKDHGLTPALMTGTGTSFRDGLIRRELHDKFEAAFHEGIDMCAEVGCPSLIALPGERRGMPREEARDNAVAILSRVKGYAEQKGVTLCMEITNSKVAADQRTDQVFDRLEWGLDVCRLVNSPRAARVVERRFFGGLHEHEVAEVLGVSVITMKRDWKVARAWLPPGVRFSVSSEGGNESRPTTHTPSHHRSSEISLASKGSARTTCSPP